MGVLPRDVDVQPARRGRRPAAQAGASELVAGRDQVGVDDHGLQHARRWPAGRRQRPAALGTGCRPYRPQQGQRPRPGVRRRQERLRQIPVQGEPGGRHAGQRLHHHRHAGRDLQPEPAVDHGRCGAGLDHRDASGDQCGRHSGDLQRHRLGAQLHYRGDAVVAHTWPWRDQELHGQADPDRVGGHQRLELRLPDLDRWQPHRPQPRAGTRRCADRGARLAIGPDHLGQPAVHGQDRLQRPHGREEGRPEGRDAGRLGDADSGWLERQRVEAGLPGRCRYRQHQGLQLQRAGRHRGVPRGPAPGGHQRCVG
mmetsp:Transcript_17019/g.40550  ORF Transcript_17019/g.40550 Transcript_17019/m.40550 type:complete len:311 (-) Transcript_17019:1407-2339(-)